MDNGKWRGTGVACILLRIFPYRIPNTSTSTNTNPDICLLSYHYSAVWEVNKHRAPMPKTLHVKRFLFLGTKLRCSQLLYKRSVQRNLQLRSSPELEQSATPRRERRRQRKRIKHNTFFTLQKRNSASGRTTNCVVFQQQQTNPILISAQQPSPVIEMEEELMKSMRLRQADNSRTTINKPISQPVATPAPTNIFGAHDAKRMSFDGNMPYSVSPTSGFNLTSGLIGGTSNFNRDRRDSLKNIVHLQDFGTD